MRLRFFSIIFAILVLVAIGSIVVHDIYLRHDRMALIDQLVRNTAASLVDFEQSDFRRIDFVAGEKVVSHELGPSRATRAFIVKDDTKKQIIYESPLAREYGLLDVDPSKKWTQFVKNGKFVRVLNLDAPMFPSRSLRVAYIIDEELVATNYFSKTSLVYFAIILMLGFSVSLLLTSWLLQPVAKIGSFLNSVSGGSQHQALIPKLPDSILPNSKIINTDEFTKMADGLNELISKVNKNYQFSRLWAHQLAHELKTPLAILRLEIEKIQKMTNLPTEETEPLTVESQKISETINSFLAWAELENSSQRQRPFANHLGTVTQNIVRRLDRFYPGRIEIISTKDPIVLATPQHLEQLITNLLSNALAYSEKAVQVSIQSQSLIVKDTGPGIPDEVLERLGEPFNRGDSRQSPDGGSGLGLAWVQTICRRYSWAFQIQSTKQGTEIVVLFPSEIEQFIH